MAYLRAGSSGSFVAIETRDVAGGPAVPAVEASPTEALRGLAWFGDGRLFYSVGQADLVASAGTLSCRHWQMRLDPVSGRPLEAPQPFARSLPQCIGPMTVTADLRHAVFQQWAFQDTISLARLDETGTVVANPVRLTLEEGRNIPSGWTADGRRFVFVSDASGSAVLLRQSVDAEAAEVIVRDPAISGAARLTPDGASVLYVVHRRAGDPAAGQKLMKVAVAGGASQEVLRGRLVDGGARCAVAPARLCAIAERSPDGGQIVFTAVDPDRGRGSELVRFEAGSGGDYRWALSPDAGRIAVLDAKGSRIHILSTAGGASSAFGVKGWSTLGYVSWAADGNGLVVASQQRRGAALLQVDLEGNARVLWQQSGSLETSGIPARDGRHIAIWVRTRAANMWMADRP